MLTSPLMHAMERAQSPIVVRALDWALRKSTGTDSSSAFSEAAWYQHNGFYRIANQLAGYNSYSGRSVTLETGLDCAALFSGTKIISEDLGALPFHTYERSKDGKTIERATQHGLYRALHDLTNPEVSAGEFVETLTAHAILTGNGYANIQRMTSGIYLWPWQPEEVRTDRNKNGALFYLRKDGRGPEKTYPASDVFHLRGFTLDGINGESLLKRGRHVLGIALSAEEYAGRFFGQDAAPGLVISRPAGLPAWNDEVVKAVKAKWKEWHQGVANSHEPAILQDGATIGRVAQTNQELQLLEVRQNQILHVCMLLRMPPHKMAMLDRATHSNIEHQAIEYITNTLSPWIDRWRRAVYRCLLTTDEQLAGRIWAEHDVAALLRGDFAEQTAGFQKLLASGVYCINDVRHWLNLNPVEGGDAHFIQLNMATIQDVASGAAITADATGRIPIGKQP
jgi:HK97 family phage portal protein